MSAGNEAKTSVVSLENNHFVMHIPTVCTNVAIIGEARFKA
jgi:hypothetical protein